MTSVIERARNVDFTRAMFDPWPVVAGWVVSAVVAIAVPWGHWNKKRQQYYKYAGQYQQYNQANNGEYQQYGNNCSWWNWGCSNNNNYNRQQYNNNQYQQNQNQNNQNYRFPNWFSMLGGTTEEQRREQGEQQSGQYTPSAVRFIHAWTNLLFVGLVIYGAVSLARGNNLNSARTAFFIFLQFAIMMMILIPQGAIQTDDREMENSVYGWYGQLGVLMVYQDFWYALFSVGACCFLTGRMVWLQRQAKAPAATSTTYKTMEEEKGDIA